MTLAAFYPELVQRVVLLCPVSFRPWPASRTRRAARMAFNPAAEWVTWGIVHRMLRRDPDRALPRLVEDLSTLPATEMVARIGPDRDAMVEFLLSCRSSRGFVNDLRSPTDVTPDVRQPTLVVASRNDGAVVASTPSSSPLPSRAHGSSRWTRPRTCCGWARAPSRPAPPSPSS